MHRDDAELLLISEKGRYAAATEPAEAGSAAGVLACRIGVGYSGEYGRAQVFFIEESGEVLASLPFDTETEARRHVRECYPELRWEFVIDGEAFDDLAGFYREMERLFTRGMEQKVGHNLDAFNDLLRGGFGLHGYGEPIVIKWINYDKSRKDLGYEATAEHYRKMMEICHPASRELLRQRREAALAGQGRTLLDMIEETILDVDDSGHYCTLETFPGARADGPDGGQAEE